MCALKIGVVGAGIIGEDHAKAIGGNDRCELVGVADIVIERARQMTDVYGGNSYEDYRVMMEAEKPDAVILNLPHFLHCEVSVYFLCRGVHVLVEKPMAMTVAECEAMMDAAEKHGAKLAVGHVQRYFAANKKAKELIAEGAIGKLCMITERRSVNYFTPQRPGWFLDKARSGGGITMNYGAHTLDRIQYMTGLGVERVCSHFSNQLTEDSVESHSQSLLLLQQGVSASITYSGCRVPAEYECLVDGTEGTIKIRGNHELWLGKDGTYAPVELPGNRIFDEQLEQFLALLEGKPSYVMGPEDATKIIQTLEEILA